MSCKPASCILFFMVTCDYSAWNSEIILFILRVHQRAFWYLIYPNTLRYKTGLKNDQTILLTNREQGWRHSESTRLPQVRPRFKSWHQRHTWIKFVVGSPPCSEGFSGNPTFPLSLKTTTSKFQSGTHSFSLCFYLATI